MGVLHKGEMRNVYKILARNLKRSGQLEDMGVLLLLQWIILLLLKWIINEY
jgi:hypothetical protein